MSWRTRWLVYEYIRNSMWIVPALMVGAAIAAGLTIPIVDKHTSVTIGISFGTDAARSVLGAISGGMITFTGFVFSILLLAVQFGSSQFSPRMLRRFLRDPSTKLALGVFMATFIYALTVLRVVGTGTNSNFVPNNAVSVAVILLLLSMLMFLRLITRTTQGLRVAAVLRDLGRDSRKLVGHLYPNPVGDGGDGGDGGDDGQTGPPSSTGPTRTVTHRGPSGILQSVNVKGIVAQAQRAGVVVELRPRLGDLVARGAVLFTVHGSGAIDDGWLQRAVAVGDERTMRQDPAFALRLLADISARALSPGVNDPTTATQALDQIELVLRELGTRRLDFGTFPDDQGVVRLWLRAPSWEDYLSLAVDETRQYGRESVQVTRRLRALLEDLRDAVPPSRWPAIDAELELVDAAAQRVFPEPGDRIAAGASDRQGLGSTEHPQRRRAGTPPS